MYYWDGHATVNFSPQADAFADALQGIFTDRAVEEPLVYDGLWGAFLHNAVLHACDRCVVTDSEERPPTVSLPDVVLAAPILPIAVHHRRKQLRQVTGLAPSRAATTDSFCGALLAAFPAVDGTITVSCSLAAARLRPHFPFVQGGRCIYHYLAALMTDDGPLDYVPLAARGQLPEVPVPVNLQVLQDPLDQIQKGQVFLAQMRDQQKQQSNRNATQKRRGSQEVVDSQKSQHHA